MSKLKLTMAVSHYDHVIDIALGRVEVEGVELNMMELPLHDIFQRTVGFADFDIAEMSMAKYVSMRSQGDDRLIALPVFLSRVARHSAIYVRRDRIKTAADFAAVRDAFLSGYREVRALPEAEAAQLPLFLLVRSLVQLGWLHERPEIDPGEWLEPRIAQIRLHCRALLAEAG